MRGLELERAHLGKAERHIAEGEQRLTRQGLLVDDLRRRGAATVEAQALYRALEQTLRAWRAHRADILAAIARLEAARDADPGPAREDPAGA